MDLWAPNNYHDVGHQKGRDGQLLGAALAQAHAVQSVGFPAILSLRHLAEHAQVPYGFLREVVGRQIDAYRSFPMKKRPKGYRIICVPDSPLLRVQRWIQQYVLQNVRPHPSSHAYAKGCSPLGCARMHAGCKWLVKIDIRRFFESIDEITVYRAFRECGYQALVAFEMARLTTRLPDFGHRPRAGRWVPHGPDRYLIRSYISRHLGHLPQGAPTSPMLANLAMRKFDAVAERIAHEFNLVYTRYSDDLIFSTGDPKFRRGTAAELTRRIYGLLRAFDLEPKTSKMNVVPPGARRVVLGLAVNDSRPRLTREVRRSLECHVYFVVKLGYAIHARERKFESALGCFRYLQGLIAHACQVDPEFGGPLRESLSSVPPPF